MPSFPSPIESKLPNVGTTIFTVMSRLAQEHNAINLSQGFPDFDCAKPLRDPVLSLSEIGAVAANVMARAIARGVYEARALPFPGAKPAWKDKFGR